MNTYQVELPNGVVITRNSKKSFTHAVLATVVLDGIENGFAIWGFASNESLATSRMATLANRTKKNAYAGTTYKVIAVKAVNA